MNQNESRTPISARVKKSVKDRLVKEAKSGKQSLGELIEGVLEDYVKWLDNK